MNDADAKMLELIRINAANENGWHFAFSMVEVRFLLAQLDAALDAREHCLVFSVIAAERDAAKARVAELEARLNGYESWRCQKIIGGEQCGRPINHEGKCVWLRGD